MIDHHRHHGKVRGSITQLALYAESEIVAVALFGRTVAPGYKIDEVCEVTRLCAKKYENDKGYPNACSKLYSSCARIAREMGFLKIITYIGESESGASLKAAGWHFEVKVKVKEWKHSSGVRTRTVTNLFGTTEKYPISDEYRERWARILTK